MQLTKEKYGLNDEQWLAITSKSPTIVNASAGSGKTRCLTSKVQYLLDQGTDPKNICAVTFTNKAADELKERIGASNKTSIEEMQVSTLHSMCVRIIRAYTQHTPLRSSFSIYDDANQLNVYKTILKAGNYIEEPGEAMSAISKAKSLGSDTDIEDALDGNLSNIYRRYQAILTKNNACDFDDLLIYALKCLKHKDCQEFFTNLWQHILVDEMQDTSKVQYLIITHMYDPKITKTLYVVGDYNQSIYAFRGAYPANMEDFITTYKPSICHLTYNYRSFPEIITFANEFRQYGKDMIAKMASAGGSVSLTSFNDNEDEANRIGQAVAKMGDFEDTAIIYRVNARSHSFERSFALKGIPYQIKGDLPFYKRRVSKDLLAFLKAANNPEDIESLARIINVPPRGFGDAKTEKLLLEGLPYLDSMIEEVPKVKNLMNILKRVRGWKPIDALSEIVMASGYGETLKNDSDQSMLEMVMRIVTGFKTVQDLILYTSFYDDDGDNKKGVKFMTAHASKGLEFKRVFVVGVEEGVWPHFMSTDTEEESRLFYVAATRAKKYLNISYTKMKTSRGQIAPSYPSLLFQQSYKKLFGKEMTISKPEVPDGFSSPQQK